MSEQDKNPAGGAETAVSKQGLHQKQRENSKSSGASDTPEPQEVPRDSGGDGNIYICRECKRNQEPGRIRSGYKAACRAFLREKERCLFCSGRITDPEEIKKYGVLDFAGGERMDPRAAAAFEPVDCPPIPVCKPQKEAAPSGRSSLYPPGITDAKGDCDFLRPLTEVTVGLGTSFNHPYEQFGNFKPHVTIKQTLSEGDELKKTVRQLQRDVYEILIAEKKRILDLCHCQRESETEFIEE